MSVYTTEHISSFYQIAVLFFTFSRQYLLTTLDASVPSSGQQPSDDGLSTGLPELMSDLRLTENEESVSQQNVIGEEKNGAEKTGNHESDEQSDDVSVSDEQSVPEESVPNGEITRPDHSALPDEEIMLGNELTEANFLKYFFVAVSKPDQIRGENQQGTTGKFQNKTLADLSWRGLLKKLFSKSDVVVG